jgi:GH24 family phage-related lysozyme (muramidase)
MNPEELAMVRHYLIKNEGWHQAVYYDSLGIPTVGVGFNLRRADAPEKIRALDLDYEKLLKREQMLSDAQIEMLFAQDLHTAAAAAEALIPGWVALAAGRKKALTDMAFNLGAGGLAKFSRFLTAVNRENWQAAEAEIMNSLYARQVGPRARRNAVAIRHGDASPS